ISGESAIKESQDEGFLQWQLKGKPNILPLLDSVETIKGDGMPVLYQFFPLASLGNGEDFAKRLSHLTDPTLQDKLFMFVAHGFLNGVANAHFMHIYHLDIKPSNFVIDHEGVAYLIDFGCAKKIEPQDTNNNQATPWVTEFCKGDNGYFSPERNDNEN